MNKIESFTIDHLRLLPGLYVSRRDEKNGNIVTTFDLRFIAPNKEAAMSVPAIHTIEHLAATYLRNSAKKDDILYFGPMGCRTGFYLLVFGETEPADIYDLILATCDFILAFEGDIPGATPKECGNYAEHDLAKAKAYVGKYRDDLATYKRFTYPA